MLLAPVTAGTGDTGLQLSTTRIACNSITIQAHVDNATAPTYIGDSTVGGTAKRGLMLTVPTATVVPFLQFTSGSGTNSLNLADFYAVSTQAAQKVQVLYTVV